MKRMKRLLALLLALCCLLPAAEMRAEAANALDAITLDGLNGASKYKLDQEGVWGPCVYYSCYMMALRRMDIDGVGTSKASLSAFQNVATSDGVSVKDNFSYSFGSNKYTFRRIRLYKSSSRYFYPALRKNYTLENGLADAEEVKRLLIHQLSLHPEGVVVWRANKEEDFIHAVLVTHYDPSTGLFWCTDPDGGVNRKLGTGLISSGDNVSSDDLKRQTYMLQRINSFYVIAATKLSTTKSFTVKYDANGGTGTMEPSTFTYGETAKLPECTFTREGYKFAGWWALRTFDSRWYCMMGEPGWAVYMSDESINGAVSRVWAKSAMFSDLGIENPHLFADGASVKNLGLVDGGSITMRARWVEAPEEETPAADETAPVLEDITADNYDDYATDAYGAFARPGSSMTFFISYLEKESESISLTIELEHRTSGAKLRLESGELECSGSGNYEFDCGIPADTAEGIWELTGATIEDAAGNSSAYAGDSLPNEMWFVVSEKEGLLSVWDEYWEDDGLHLTLSFSYSQDLFRDDHPDYDAEMPPEKGENGAAFCIAWYDADGKLLAAENADAVSWDPIHREDFIFPAPEGAARWRFFALGSSTAPLCARLGSSVPEA